jgi:hypothetical protein
MADTSDAVQSLLGINNFTLKESQYRLTTTIEQPTPAHNLTNAINVLFYLATLYGRWDIRHIQEADHLRSITIQLPILSQNTYLLNWFEKMHHHLQSL